MISLLIILLSSLFLGRTALRLAKADSNLGWAVTTGIGLGVWCLILFLLGHAQLFNRTLLIILSSGFAGAALPHLWKHRENLSSISLFFKQPSWLEKSLILSAGFILILTFAGSFAPVVGGVGNDEISCHLLMPKEWLAAGNIAVLPYLASYLAGNGQLLFLLASCFSPEAGPHLVSWLSLILCLSLIYSLTLPRAGRTAALIAITAIAANPLIFRTSTVAFVDIESALFVLLVIKFLLTAHETGNRRLILFAGALAGIGCGIKPTGFVHAAVLTIFVLFISEKSISARVRQTFRFALVAFLFALPWMFRTTLLTGSPVFPPPKQLYSLTAVQPLLNNPAPFTRESIEGYYDHCQARYGTYKRSLKNFIRFPWDFTMEGKKFQIGDSIGVLALSILPLAFLFLPLPAWSVLLLGYTGLTTFILYFMVLPEARYYIPALMVLSPLIGWTLVKLIEKPALKKTALLVLILNLLFCCAVAGRTLFIPIRAAVMPSYKESYKRTSTPYFEAMAYLKTVGAEKVIITAPNEMTYYLNTRYIIDPRVAEHPAKYPGAYVLDMDYSQNLKRDWSRLTNDYSFEPTAEMMMVFNGYDAKVYRIVTLPEEF